MKRKIFSVLFALVLVLSFSLVAAVPAAAIKPLAEPDAIVLGGDIATAVGAQGSSDQYYLGSGCWQAVPGDPTATGKMELYIDPTVAPFDSLGTFTIDDIASISYGTNKPGAQGPVDFYLAIYTVPDQTDDTTDWYGYRLNAEPYFSQELNAPAGQWNIWTTDDGTNQLTFFDTAKTGGYGSYNQPTLQDLQAGTINWHTYNASYDDLAIDYGVENVKYITFQTGTGWMNTFDGYIDAITIELTTGDPLTIDLEQFYNEVWVDDDAAAEWYVPSHFANIQAGIDNVAPSGTVHVAAGAYNENILIDKALTVRSADGAEETIIDGITQTVVWVRHSGVTFEGFTVTLTNPDWPAPNGILVSDPSGEDATNVNNIYILNNIVTQIRSKTGSYFGATGINIGPSSDVVVSGNIIENIHTGEEVDPNDHTCGIVFWGTTEMNMPFNIAITNNEISDIRFNGILLQYASNVQIENNPIITGCETGIRVEPFEGVTVSDLTVNSNKFADNSIQVFDGAEALVIEQVLANNIFDRAVTVDHKGASLLHTIWSSIQDAIDEATGGDTVIVAPGIYSGVVQANKSVQLLGANAGIPGTGTRADESIIDGAGATGISITPDPNVIVDGFTITNCDYGIAMQAEYITIQNCIFNPPFSQLSIRFLGPVAHTVVTNNLINGAGIKFASGQPLCDDIAIIGNTLINACHGMRISDATDVRVIGNDFSGCGTAVMLFDNVTYSLIDDNYIVDSPSNGITLQNGYGHPSSNNTVTRNIIDSCVKVGIEVWGSGNNYIANNQISNAQKNGIFVGIHPDYPELLPTANTIEFNELQDNNIQVLDAAEVLVIEDVLPPNNTFDRAVTVDHLGASLLHTIWSSIQDGVDAATGGDTVKVAAGIYKEHITIDKSNLRLMGEDKQTTIIDATQDSSWPIAKPGILIGEYPLIDGVHGVTVSGFTIRDAAMQEGSVAYEGEKYGVGPQALAGILIYNSSSNTIENNILINNYWQIFLCAEWPAAGYTECMNNRIANNIIQNSENDGVYLYSDGGVFVQDTEIIENEISNAYGEFASGVEFWGWPEGGDTPTISSTVIKRNLITGCTYGVRIRKDVSDITGTSINLNNFITNTNYGVYNGVASTVDATRNYWGHPTGPSRELPHGKHGKGVGKWVGKGDRVSDNVDYMPWLRKSKEKIVPTKKPAYARHVVLDKTGEYGWNTFSTPIFLDDEADTWKELHELTELDYSLAYRFDSDTQKFVPLPKPDEYAINPGEGFFIKMKEVGSLSILYSTKEKLIPPSRGLKAGWNLIGLANLEDMNVDDAFASIATVAGIAGYSQVVSPIGNASPGPVLAGGTIYVGESYWVYMLGARKLAGFTMTPVDWVP